jgi:hypothetical protein
VVQRLQRQLAGKVTALNNVVELGQIIISSLGVIVSFLIFSVMRRQLAVMRQQVAVTCEHLAESRLDTIKRRSEFRAAIKESLDGSVRALLVNFPHRIPVINVSEDLDSDDIACVAELAKEHRYDDFIIEVYPDLV